MATRTIVILLILAVIIAALGYVFVMYRLQIMQPQTKDTSSLHRTLAPEIESLLSAKLSLISTLGEDSAISLATIASNANSQYLSAVQISELDATWQRAKPNDPFIQTFLTNEVARVLKLFQVEHPEFKEIFVADGYGLNVGQTNKTTDYYQADESWWVESYNRGRGKMLHGEIEFDESSQSEAISLYVPVRGEGQVVGVVKAVLDLDALKREL